LRDWISLSVTLFNTPYACLSLNVQRRSGNIFTGTSKLRLCCTCMRENVVPISSLETARKRQHARADQRFHLRKCGTVGQILRPSSFTSLWRFCYSCTVCSQVRTSRSLYALDVSSWPQFHLHICEVTYPAFLFRSDLLSSVSSSIPFIERKTPQCLPP
jgi:hypothetical protein